MASLSLYLLGAPRVEIDGRPIRIHRRKSLALLAYLAVTGVEHRRDALALLLWPDSDQERARGSLRRELSSLNQLLDGDWLRLDCETTALNPDAEIVVDVIHFQELLAGLAGATDRRAVASLIQAASLYQADFLAGFTLAGCHGFDEWQFFESESCRLKFAEALDALVTRLESSGEVGQAIAYARRRVTLDPLHEAAHRRLMRLYMRDGRHAAALRQFDECARILDEELAVRPEADTLELAGQIREQRRSPQRSDADAASVQPAAHTTATSGELRMVTILLVALPQNDEELWSLAPDRLGDLARRLEELSLPVLETFGASDSFDS